jgi:hypothetical protein
MYLIVAFAVTVLVIALAWRGIGITRQGPDGTAGSSDNRPRLQRPPRPAPRRFIAPDDDPEFLSEIDRRLREEGKNNN